MVIWRRNLNPAIIGCSVRAFGVTDRSTNTDEYILEGNWTQQKVKQKSMQTLRQKKTGERSELNGYLKFFPLKCFSDEFSLIKIFNIYP